MKFKKIISILAATSILGTSIVTPLSIISTEALAATFTVSNPNLATATGTVTGSGTAYKSDLWTVEAGNTITTPGGITANLTPGTNGWNSLTATPNISSGSFLSGTSLSIKHKHSQITNDSVKTTVSRSIQTEPGKEYTISFYLETYKTGSPSNWSYSVGMTDMEGNILAKKDTSITSANVQLSTWAAYGTSQTVTFKATSDTTRFFTYMETPKVTSVSSNESDTAIRSLVINKSDAQVEKEMAEELARQATANEALKNLFIEQNTVSSITEATNQETLNHAQDLINNVLDTDKKAEFQRILDQAKKQLDDRISAEAAVKALTDNQDIILPTTSQTNIDNAQSLINLMPSSPQKIALQETLNAIQTQLDERNATIQAEKDRQTAATKAIKELFTNDDTSSDSIKVVTDQTAINNAKELVNQVTDPAIKTALENDISRAQSLLDAEKNRQSTAINAVKELFTNDDTSSDSIKDVTDQTAINNAKELVNQITDPTIKAALENDISKAQSLLDAYNATIQAEKDRQDTATNAVKELFTNDDTSSDSIKVVTDQTAINNAKELVNQVTNPAIKATLENDISKAQSLLDAYNAAVKAEKDRQDIATNAVKELFINDDTSSDSIKNTTSQDTINNAKELVSKVTDPTVKAALEQDIAKAQALLDAKQIAAENTVKALFNNDDTKGTIKDTTNQTAIDAAQQLVNSVIDPAKKSELQQAVNKAQRQLALGEVTIDTYTIGGNYITGTTKTGVTKVGIYVDGKLIRTAAASNGTYQIYASTAPELQVTGQAFEVAPIATDGTIGLKSNSVVSAKVAPKKIAKPMIDDYFKGTSYITGTVSSEAKKIALYIDGQFVRYGAVTGDTFKIYASDVALMKTEGQTFEVVAVDNLGNEGERASSDVKSKTVKGNVLPNETTTLSTYNTGTVTGDVHMIALYVDGKFVRYGAVTGTDYKVYIYDVPALRIAGTTFEVKALDTAGNVLYTSTQIVQ